MCRLVTRAPPCPSSLGPQSSELGMLPLLRRRHVSCGLRRSASICDRATSGWLSSTTWLAPVRPSSLAHSQSASTGLRRRARAVGRTSTRASLGSVMMYADCCSCGRCSYGALRYKASVALNMLCLFELQVGDCALLLRHYYHRVPDDPECLTFVGWAAKEGEKLVVNSCEVCERPSFSVHMTCLLTLLTTASQLCRTHTAGARCNGQPAGPQAGGDESTQEEEAQEEDD